MDILEEIENKWGSKEQTELSQILPEILDLLILARQSDQKVPLELELDIVMTANYAMEYGTTTSALNHISSLWVDGFNRLKKSSEVEQDLRRKISRLNSILANSIIGSLLYDLQNGLKVTSSSISLLGSLFEPEEITEDYIDQSLFVLAHSLSEFLLVAEMSNWFYENISDFVTTLSLLKDRNQSITHFESYIEQISDRIRKFGESFSFEDWEKTFFEHTERYRFISIMMNTTNPKDMTWRGIAKRFKSD